MPRKIARQQQLRNIFTLFAVSNQVVILDNAQVQEFWNKTTDAFDQFRSREIYHLRQQLYDHASHLLFLNHEKNSKAVSKERKAQSQRDYAEEMKWFKNSAQSMEALFDTEAYSQDSVKSTLAECVHAAGKILPNLIKHWPRS